MVGWLPAITPSAPNSALVMQVEASTLPATTEAGALGLSMQPWEMRPLKGWSRPGWGGLSSPTGVGNTYSAAAMPRARGDWKLWVGGALVPERSMPALGPAVSTVTATRICAPLS